MLFDSGSDDGRVRARYTMSEKEASASQTSACEF